MEPSCIPEPVQQSIQRAANILKNKKSILFITGAGLSADSGLPTYRGIGGLYNQEHPQGGYPIEVALSGEMLISHPEIPWKHIMEIEQACRGAKYNRGHEVIAEMERQFPRVWVLTQNVDGFHRAAGSSQVIDIHGDIHYLECMQCSRQTHVDNYSKFSELPPRCPECQGVIRPQVVLFNEMLPREKMNRLRLELTRGFDVIFSVGTSNLFPYITSPLVDASYRGIDTIEINPATTQISSRVRVKIAWTAAAALEALWEKVKKQD